MTQNARLNVLKDRLSAEMSLNDGAGTKVTVLLVSIISVAVVMLSLIGEVRLSLEQRVELLQSMSVYP